MAVLLCHFTRDTKPHVLPRRRSSLQRRSPRRTCGCGKGERARHLRGGRRTRHEVRYCGVAHAVRAQVGGAKTGEAE